MRVILLVILCCLVPVFVFGQAIDEQKVDCLLLIIFELACLAYFVLTLAHGAFFPLFCVCSVFVLVWNAGFVQWWGLFRLNCYAVPGTLFLTLVHGKK